MRKTPVVAALLFGSGLCALVYQTTWLREFRLVFGASTPATAAVLAIFMGGLGVGSAVLGRYADHARRPLAFYGFLELAIAVNAAVSPLLLAAVRWLYIVVGGSVTLGSVGATVVRLLLAAVVLGVPTFLMGGTLPMASRAVREDAGRRQLAVLYALNTLGAVTGTLISTFYLLERLGNRRTLLAAAALNIAIGVIAVAIGRSERGSGPEFRIRPIVNSGPDPHLVLPAAAITGFAFLLMELVWYRMLTPILGGTTFTFGLILAVALAGIGLGGIAYSLWSGPDSPAPGSFAVTCALEALAVAFPFALGDRLAVLANLLRSLSLIGFGGDILGWTIITLIVVFPAALISGIQFPLLIALLGRGDENVGRHVGLAYAWNTAGAILGSLAGGFGLMPLLSAPGCWRLVAVLLTALGIAAAVFGSPARRIATGVIAAAAISAIAATGPTALWRHSGIGAGRARRPETLNKLRDWMRNARREVLWQRDGQESSIAVIDLDDRIFMVNGKADGSARGDAGTQVMAGMIGAFLHPDPRRSLVIGLGTGSTAGWLAAVPTMERVDVVELEPLVLRVARDNAAVNHDALR